MVDTPHLTDGCWLLGSAKQGDERAYHVDNLPARGRSDCGLELVIGR
jgi:hypothetical protein